MISSANFAYTQTSYTISQILMGKYGCIIFDCDGVLVDTESISNQVFLEMAKPFGYELELGKAIEKFSGRSLQECLEMVEEKIQGKLPQDFIETFRKRTFEAFKHHVKPIKGIPQLLNKLTIPYCTASSGPIEKIELNLKTAGLFEKFEGRIFSSYEINSWKPDPGIFLYAAKKMGFKPKECLVIEDTLVGLQAAKSGGFDVYGFSNGKNRSEFDKIADRTFLDMEELRALIGEV